jgi:hypothetical protein
MNKENFIEKSRLIHNDNFDYCIFEYTGSKNKSTLICKICKNKFLTTPSNHLLGNGCKNCYEFSKIDRVKILESLEKKNKNWLFNLENYKNSDSDINYICNNGHTGKSTYRNMTRFNVCKKCGELNLLEKKKKKIEDNNIKILEYNSDKSIKYKCIDCNHISINNYRAITYEKYKCKYCILLNSSELLKSKKIKLLDINGIKIKLECDKGHIYKQDRMNLLSGRGCNECRIANKGIDKEHLIPLFKSIHGDYFTYNIENYKNVHTKIDITCRNGHNFKQKVSNHLQGKGCNICRESAGERFIAIYLESNNIKYTRQKRYKDCKYINILPFDFHLTDYDILIEYDGIQHFKPIDVFGGEKEFAKTQIRDKIKNEYCLNNNIHLIRVSYLENIVEKLSINELIGL